MKSLAALAVMLLALLGWESLPASDDPVTMPSGVTFAASAALPDPLPVAAWVDVAQARPLFARDRRPTPHPPGAPNPAGAGDGLPRLAGTVRSDHGLVAILVPVSLATVAGAPDAAASGIAGSPVAAGPGGIVAGWTVVDITDALVTLERDGRSATLLLSYANMPAAAHSEAPASVVVLHERRSNPFLQP